MATAHGETATAVLQPDWHWGYGSQGRQCTINLKGSEAMVLNALPAIGSNFNTANIPQLSEVPSLPASMIVVGVEMKAIGGGEAVGTVVGAYDRKEDLSWVTVEKALENNPKVKAVLTAVQISAARGALNTDQARTDFTTPGRDGLADGHQKYLYDLFAKRIDSWSVYLPMITVSYLEQYDDTNKAPSDCGGRIKTPAEVAEVASWHQIPSADSFGTAYTYITQPEGAAVENTIAVTKFSYIGFPGVEAWMYGTGNMPTAS